MEKTKTLPKNRIQSACKELEEALSNFENESGEELRLERQKRLEDIKNQLVEIKSQLEELS